jgi:hypothetical protein
MQITTFNKIIAQLLVGALAVGLAVWLFRFQLVYPYYETLSTPTWWGSFQNHQALLIALGGVIAIAALAVVGMALEGLSFLQAHPLVRALAEHQSFVSWFHFQRLDLRDLEFSRMELRRTLTTRRKHLKGSGCPQIYIQSSVAHDAKLRRFATVLFLSKANKDLQDWTLSHYGAYYFCAAALQLLYLMLCGEAIVVLTSSQIFASPAKELLLTTIAIISIGTMLLEALEPSRFRARIVAHIHACKENRVCSFDFLVAFCFLYVLLQTRYLISCRDFSRALPPHRCDR